jgi:hypothetical protein
MPIGNFTEMKLRPPIRLAGPDAELEMFGRIILEGASVDGLPLRSERLVITVGNLPLQTE